MADITEAELAALIDHTNLYADATIGDIEQLCAEAAEYGFGAVCVYPADVATAEQERVDDAADYNICAVAGGFPHGRVPAAEKAAQAEAVVEAGADEIDMVLNRGHIKDGYSDRARQEVRAVREAVPDATLKVITENCDLTDAEKVDAYQAAINGGADFLKTSTGFGDHGATVEDAALMAETIDGADADVGIKAAGGIADAETALTMVDAAGYGADPDRVRIGASSGPAIVRSLGGDGDG